jgi:hypothetical protein
VKHKILSIGHVDDRNDSICHKHLQKAVLAIFTASFMLQFSCDDFWNEKVVRYGREDSFTIFARVKVNQYAGVENPLVHDINPGA